MNKMLIYRVLDGLVVAKIPENTPYENLYDYELSKLIIDDIPRDWHNYKVINGKLVKLSGDEIRELRIYGKFLSDEEKLLNKLKPSPEEIRKAEQTIEILSLLNEVI